jgi:probable addiction module antidote protein
MALELDPTFDPAEFFTDAASQADLINDAFSSGNAGYIANAFGIVARARGMAGLARETGINRQTLYKAFSAGGNPTLDTMAKVVGAMGFQLAVQAVDQHSPLLTAETNAFRERAIAVTATGEEAVIGKAARVVEEVVVSEAGGKHVESISDTIRGSDGIVAKRRVRSRQVKV